MPRTDIAFIQSPALPISRQQGQDNPAGDERQAQKGQDQVPSRWLARRVVGGAGAARSQAGVGCVFRIGGRCLRLGSLNGRFQDVG